MVVSSCLVAATAPASADVQTMNQTVRVSVDLSGGDPNGSSWVTDISADGRLVLFQSRATDLTDFLEPGSDNAYLADLDTGEIEWVAAGPDLPGPADNGSFNSSMSADGRFVVFDTRRPLDPQDTNHPYLDVYRRDRLTGAARMVSGTYDGGAGNAAAGLAQVSDDGRWVSFVSDADEVVEGVEGFDIPYIRDMEVGVTQVAVRRLDGTPDGGAWVADLSADGRYALVLSDSDDLVVGDAPDSAREVYLRDLATGRTIRVGPGPASLPAVDTVRYASMTPDASIVLYHDTPVDGSSALPGRLIVRDRVAGTVLEVDRGNKPLNPLDTAAQLSDDGRHVVFASGSTDLVDRPEWRAKDVFVRDLATGRTMLVPVSRRDAAANGSSFRAALDADGSTVAFTSLATNLALPVDENGWSDVYWRKIERPA
jgi:hypothetical protein